MTKTLSIWKPGALLTGFSISGAFVAQLGHDLVILLNIGLRAILAEFRDAACLLKIPGDGKF